MRTVILRSGTLTAALVALSCPALAVRARLGAKAEEYAAAHKLPVRTVAVDLAGRQTERHFVPILPATRADFETRFSAAHGAILWHQSNVPAYVHLQIDPATRIFRDAGATYPVTMTKELAYGLLPPQYFEPRGEPSAGHMMALALEPPEIEGMKAFFAANGDQNAWRANHPNGNIGAENCMWWLMHAEVGNHLPLAHALGVTRSRAPENLLKKLLHAGNDRVGPVGVPVNTVEEFTAMTDAQLMGPPPVGGAADAIEP
jgi:hypothetical protein